MGLLFFSLLRGDPSDFFLFLVRLRLLLSLLEDPLELELPDREDPELLLSDELLPDDDEDFDRLPELLLELDDALFFFSVSLLGLSTGILSLSAFSVLFFFSRARSLLLLPDWTISFVYVV